MGKLLPVIIFPVNDVIDESFGDMDITFSRMMIFCN